MDYNGWKNYETWNVKLWIDNDESEYSRWREMTRDIWSRATAGKAYATQTRLQAATAELADTLKSEHEENVPESTGVYADLLNAALSNVDWYEIAEHMIDAEDLTEEAGRITAARASERVRSNALGGANEMALNKQQKKILAELQTEPLTDEQIREIAKEQYGAFEIDTDAKVSRGDDNGAYVQAWVWVDFPSEG